MPVSNEEKALVLVLQLYPVGERAHPVSKVQFACGTHSAQNAQTLTITFFNHEVLNEWFPAPGFPMTRRPDEPMTRLLDVNTRLLLPVRRRGCSRWRNRFCLDRFGWDTYGNGVGRNVFGGDAHGAEQTVLMHAHPAHHGRMISNTRLGANLSLGVGDDHPIIQVVLM